MIPRRRPSIDLVLAAVATMSPGSTQFAGAPDGEPELQCLACGAARPLGTWITPRMLARTAAAMLLDRAGHNALAEIVANLRHAADHRDQEGVAFWLEVLREAETADDRQPSYRLTAAPARMAGTGPRARTGAEGRSPRPGHPKNRDAKPFPASRPR